MWAISISNQGRYDVILEAVKAKGWKLVGSSNNLEGKECSNEDLTVCNVHWVDVANIHERLLKMAPWQRINHFPGMPSIARKARMANNLEKMRREVRRAREKPREVIFACANILENMHLLLFRATDCTCTRRMFT